MSDQEMAEQIRHLYDVCIAELNEWETNFIGDMMERVNDWEKQDGDEGDLFLSQREREKIEEIWKAGIR